MSQDSAAGLFSVFLLVLIPFLNSHVSKCYFPVYMLDINSPIKEREKLPNLFKESCITLD